MKALILIVLLGLLFALTVSTNPTVQDYSEFLRAEFVQPTQDEDDDLLQAMMLLFGEATESVIVASTVRTNYIIFSTYETDLDPLHIDCIGALGQFFNCKSAED